LRGPRVGRAPRWTDLENQPLAPPRITDRDRVAGVKVDRRHPETVDEDAVGAPVDGHPMATGEPQHHIQAMYRRWWGAPMAIQRDVDPSAVAHQHVAAGGEDVPCRSDPDG
jgi:hypothetical protein